ncbi:MAG TPA: hypothetical protein VMD57_02920, partial [Candidatus Baltobacteraceae bacterium]|nr:hypothetical protein [Candidatus Baltobacteraceae bacterium]
MLRFFALKRTAFDSGTKRGRAGNGAPCVHQTQLHRSESVVGGAEDVELLFDTRRPVRQRQRHVRLNLFLQHLRTELNISAINQHLVLSKSVFNDSTGTIPNLTAARARHQFLHSRIL